MKNVDDKVVKAFGEEWDYYNQSSLKEEEAKDLFSRYFNIFPSNFLQDDKVGIDFGCGSGRWAKHIAPLVKELHCVDASYQALNVAKNNLDGFDNCILQRTQRHKSEKITTHLQNEKIGISEEVNNPLTDFLRNFYFSVEENSELKINESFFVKNFFKLIDIVYE